MNPQVKWIEPNGDILAVLIDGDGHISKNV
jgi:hypothetical protein